MDTISASSGAARGYAAPDSLDPAERIELTRPPHGGVTRFDTRSDDDLAACAAGDASALERERALWEYADRLRDDALDLVHDRARRDQDRSVRIGALWLMQKIAGAAAAGELQRYVHDEDDEVRDWALLLVDECGGGYGRIPFGRPLCIDATNPFDQTLPLMIAGYARVQVPGGWVQATLSPKWFESIMGRVMACTNEATFETDLTIEKCVFGYHGDGSNHYEGYAFRGFSQQVGEGLAYHTYVGRGTHTFYPSGKVEDASVAPLNDVTVALARQAFTARLRDPETNRMIVRSVRGRYAGEAFVAVPRLLARPGVLRIEPGEVQLSDLHHPVGGPLTNTHLFGTFKGKLGDLDGDGSLDVNRERAHAAPDGKLDYAADGTMRADPFDRRAAEETVR